MESWEVACPTEIDEIELIGHAACPPLASGHRFEEIIDGNYLKSIKKDVGLTLTLMIRETPNGFINIAKFLWYEKKSL